MKSRDIVIDGRMIQSSGIGVVLRETLSWWAEHPIEFRLRILGDPALLARLVPPQLHAEFISYKAGVYGLNPFLGSVPQRDIPLYFSPHYAVPYSALKNLSVVMIQDLIHITHPPKMFTSAYMRSVLEILKRRATYIVTPSRHTKVQLQTLYGFRPERVLTFPLGGGVCENTDDNGVISNDGDGDPYFLSVGIDKPHKGFDFLLDCYDAAIKKNSSVPRLEVAGIVEGGQSRLARKIHDMGLDQKVEIANYLSDDQFQKLLNGAQALVFPSRIEGFGLPLVEAMNNGVPVICADLPPMNEITGDAALNFDHDHKESLIKLLSDFPDRGSLQGKIARGRSRAENYRWGTFANQLEDLFQRVFSESESRS